MTNHKYPEVIEAHCNLCLRTTKHDVLNVVEQEWPERDKDGTVVFIETNVSEFLQCRGCEHICMRQTYNSNATGQEPEITYYPPAITRRQPEWLMELSFYFNELLRTIRYLLQEIYAAMFTRSYRLAAMGTRAVIDLVLTDRLGDIGGFEQKLKAAKDEGWLTKEQAKILGAAIKSGNAAGHRGFEPDYNHLNAVLDIVEHVVQLTYVLGSAADRLSKETPKRKKRQTARGKS